jgi:excisionase family DNA binding protein
MDDTGVVECTNEEPITMKVIAENRQDADPNLDYLMSTADVSKLLGCGQGFVSELIKAGLLMSLKFGRTHRIRKITLNHFLQDYEGQNLVELVQAKKIAHQAAS